MPMTRREVAEETRKQVEANRRRAGLPTQIVQLGRSTTPKTITDYYKKNEAAININSTAGIAARSAPRAALARRSNLDDEDARSSLAPPASRGLRATAVRPPTDARRRRLSRCRRRDERRLLTPAQYDVLRREGTERAAPAAQQENAGHVRLRGLRLRCLADTKYEGHRLAELLEPLPNRSDQTDTSFL